MRPRFHVAKPRHGGAHAGGGGTLAAAAMFLHDGLGVRLAMGGRPAGPPPRMMKSTARALR